MTKYKIYAKSVNGQVFTYNVESYKIEDDFVVFLDKVTGVVKRFHQVNCEISEVLE
jgi:hypothetical protein